jgi:hypothetical protein
MKISLLCCSAVLLALPSSRTVAAPPAAAAEIIISEDFETTAVGQIPKGFTKTGAIGVAEDAAHGGKHSLKIEPAVKGGRFISLPADKVAALGGEHWGRFYYKVKMPAALPLPVEGKPNPSIHTTLVAGKCTSPLANDSIEVRLAGLSLNSMGAFKYLYNVQPKAPRKEFGVSAKTTHQFSDQWTLVEWHADNATQTYQFFLDGGDKAEVEVSKGAGQFEGVELPPVFQTFSVGWTNYQPATGEGFTVWIDDLAIGKKRLGPVSGAKPSSKK